MKKTVAICTLYDNVNMGNRLQNYATQVFFQNLGYEVVTIPYKQQDKSIFKTFLFMLRRAGHVALQSVGLEPKKRIHKSQLKERRSYIGGFTKEYIPMTEPVDYHHLPSDLKEQYDYFVAGSDQVWHCWKNDRMELEFFFLMFADSSQRLTMAPSFGFEAFPDEFRKTYQEGLEGFPCLSVREERGAELIKELTGQDAVVLLDPTMLIDTSEWIKILRKPSQYVDQNYIFVYMLGEVEEEIQEAIGHLAGQMKASVVDITDISSDYYIHTRPDEFLYWIHHAKLIVTNSFHASVFSILFNRPFVVTERTNKRNMGSRLDTLLRKFGLEDRHYKTMKSYFNDESAWEKLFAVHYDAVPGILEEERKKAVGFYSL